MPYITQEKRAQIDPVLEALRHVLVELELDDPEGNLTEGNLNYAITTLLMTFYGDRNSTRYAQINAAIGMMECCKLELYRKVAGPYEDQKEHDNGACGPLQLDPIAAGEIHVEDTSES